MSTSSLRRAPIASRVLSHAASSSSGLSRSISRPLSISFRQVAPLGESLARVSFDRPARANTDVNGATLTPQGATFGQEIAKDISKESLQESSRVVQSVDRPSPKQPSIVASLMRGDLISVWRSIALWVKSSGLFTASGVRSDLKMNIGPSGTVSAH